ncbi:MAG: metal-dependent hydrolase [Sphingomonadales bacterium]|nr:metal-dependent hydrolase [Sphingomonadales bacterium]
MATAPNRHGPVRRKVVAGKSGPRATIEQAILVRRRPDWPAGSAPRLLDRRWWAGGDPIATAWFNALSATFPKGEAFFIESVRACSGGAAEPLAGQIRDFIAQEANHSREHIAFNRLVRGAGYDLSRIEARIDGLMALSRERTDAANIATTMALEHFTAIFAHDLLAHPDMLAGCDPALAALWRWHAIEEIEHKAVAYDTFLHATAGWSSWQRWWVRSLMMLVVTKTFFAHRVADALDLLRQDGLRGPKTWRRLAGFLFREPGVLRRIFPAWCSYFRPGFHPWQIDDRGLIAE